MLGRVEPCHVGGMPTAVLCAGPLRPRVRVCHDGRC